MATVCKLIKKLAGISTAAMMLVLAVYWFELDDSFLKEFEPTFRKIAARVRTNG